MFPSYRGVNSQPCQTTHMPSSPLYYPCWGSFPPQMVENPVNPPHVNEPWPHNHGYPAGRAPMPCNHGFQPTYYNYPPPCPHFPSPSTYGHCWSGCPAVCPQPYPYIPPPHYPVDVPRYDYDMNAPSSFHCCGCPNHSGIVKDKNCVRIVEHEPEVETKKTDSLVPAGVDKSPFQNVWIPPEYRVNKVQPWKVVEGDSEEHQGASYKGNHHDVPALKQAAEKEQHSNVKKPNQSLMSVEQDPNAKYRWFPMDMNSIKQLMGGENARKTLDHEDDVKANQEKSSVNRQKARDHGKEDENNQFSYPIIWMPYNGQEKEHVGDKERNNCRASAEEHPSGFKVLPVEEEHSGKINEKERTAVKDHDKQAGNSERTTKVKTIPVIQLEDSNPKITKKESECEQDGTPKGEVVEHGRKEAAATKSTKMQPSSSNKKSRLPPICLRVDPPKKKNGNGNTRSQSTHGVKRPQECGDKGDVKDKALQPTKKEIQVQEAVEKGTEGNKIEVSRGASREGKESSARDCEAQAELSAVRGIDGHSSSETKIGEPEVARESKSEDPSTPARKVMSRTEAAVMIQSAYRGYELRRLAPLMKLKQIGGIREEACRVKRQIEELECLARVDNKEQVVISETIMKLLLELDTIQGVHPSIRDVRRSVAKELTILQEKLDSAVSQKSASSNHCSDAGEGVRKDIKTSDLGGASVDSCETGGVAGNFSRLCETSGAGNIVEPETANECLDNNEVPEIQSVAAQNVIGDFVTASHDPLDDVKPNDNNEVQFDAVSSYENKEENLAAEALEGGDEKVDIEISRMDWDCDLGTAKVTSVMGDEEIPCTVLPQTVVEEQVTDQISRMEWECDLGAAKMTSLGEEKESGEANSTSTVQNVNQETVQAETHEPVIKEDEGQSSVVDISGSLMYDQDGNRFSEGPDLRCEDPVAFEIDHHAPNEVSSVDSKDSQEYESPDGLEFMKVPVVEEGLVVEPNVQVNQWAEVPSKQNCESVMGNLAACAAESNTMVVIRERLTTDSECKCDTSAEYVDRDTEVAHSSLMNLQAATLEQQQNVSETVEEEQVVGEQTLPNSALRQKDDNKASTVSLEGEGSSAEHQERDAEAAHDSLKNLQTDTIERQQNGSEAVEEEQVMGEHSSQTCAQQQKDDNEVSTVPLEGEGSSAEHQERDEEAAHGLLTKLPETEEEQMAGEHTSQTDVQQLKNDEASTLSLEGQTSPTASGNGDLIDKRVVDENEKLREMLEKLLAAGKEHQNVISHLTAKVEDLEKKLAREKKMKSAKRSRVRVSLPPCRKTVNGSFKQSTMGLAS